LKSLLFFVGTFAVVSLMTAQAIESVSQHSMNLISNNQSFSLISNVTDSFIINEKLNLATTLALLVGLIQVNFVRS
jgi:MFS superfamily sulfate permease-like transporter